MRVVDLKINGGAADVKRFRRHLMLNASYTRMASKHFRSRYCPHPALCGPDGSIYPDHSQEGEALAPLLRLATPLVGQLAPSPFMPVSMPWWSVRRR